MTDHYKDMAIAPDGAVAIHIGNGLYTWVSKQDEEKITSRKWHGKHNGINVYAVSTDRSVYKNGRKLKLHHLIIGRIKGFLVDHINGNTLDNRRSNLRHVTPSLNVHNYHNVDVRGVKPHNGRWRASITISRKYINLGLFDSESDAIAARKEAERKLFSNKKECLYVP